MESVGIGNIITPNGSVKYNVVGSWIRCIECIRDHIKK